MKSVLTFILVATFSLNILAQENISDNEHLTMATLWFQKSAEMKALYYQAYNLAQLRLDQKLENADPEKQYAVVCDIDETLLDNSPVEAKIILENYSFSDSLWQAWTRLEKAEALPGALEFTQYAASKNVKVFYVSNRSTEELEWTMNNMAALGFPNIEKEFFLLKTTTSDKKERREKVRENHEILLFCGDNLGDFTSIFDDRADNYSLDEVDNFKKEFGDRFIVLPNPMYGTWEKAIYGGTNRIPSEEKNKLRKETLISF